jgi:DNA polymerase III epsilon subunit-like protein
MMLALDTETSGLIPHGVPKGNPAWPFIVQVGAILFDLDGTERAVFGSQVRSDGKTISPGAEKVHGISTRSARRDGVSELAALAVISGFAAQASIITAFNAKFDIDIIESSLIRLGKSTRMVVRPGVEIVDLIPPAAQLCKLPSGHESGSYRWPSLDAACAAILGEPERIGPHVALHDAGRAKRLFLALRSRNLLEAA